MIKNIHRHTSVPCKNMKELKRLLWWAKKSGYKWSNGQSYNDNYMINFLEERFERATDGEKIAILPVIGMWTTVGHQSPIESKNTVELNKFIRLCKENHFQSIHA